MNKPRQLIFSFNHNDFKIDTFRGSGPGGQNRNKVNSAVRITHIKSGLSAEARDSKSQLDNKKNAFHKLCKLLVEYYRPKKKELPKIDYNKTTRTYHEPDDRVTDHITGERFSYKHTVAKGDISSIIEARIKKCPRNSK